MEKSREIYRPGRAKVVADGGRQQDKKRQSSFDEFGEVRQETPASDGSDRGIDLRRNGRAFHDTGLSIETDEWRGDLARFNPRRRRRQIAESATPSAHLVAPTATCVVALSAALLHQLTQPPSTIWQATRRKQTSVKRESRTAFSPV